MGNYKICFSVTCHESAECLRDTFERINVFAPNSCVVVHCNSASGGDFFQHVMSISNEYKNVFVNPMQVELNWGDGRLLNAIFLNFEYALQNLNFDYFWLESSNSLIMRSGIEEHVYGYYFGGNIDPLPKDSDWDWAPMVFNDQVLLNFIDKLKIKDIHVGHHEGTFATKNIFNFIYQALKNDLPFGVGDYPREETFMQTALSQLLIYKHTSAGCRLWCAPEDFYKVINGDDSWMKEQNIFSLKRVPREYDCQLRNDLRKQMLNR